MADTANLEGGGRNGAAKEVLETQTSQPSTDIATLGLSIPEVPAKVVNGDQPGASQTPSAPDIIYQAKCIQSKDVVKVFYSEEIFRGLDIITFSTTKPIPAIEIVIEVKGKVKGDRPNERNLPYVSRTQEASARFGPDGDFDVDVIQNPQILIHSEHIRKVLREIVDYYPSQNLNGKTVVVNWPYRVLVHYFDELKETAQKLSADAAVAVDLEEKAQRAAKAHDLATLLSYITPFYSQELEAEAARHRQSPSVATYDMLWLLYKPGTAVYTKMGGKYRAFIVLSISERKKTDKDLTPYWYRRRKPDKLDKWCITVWYLALDGKRLYRRKRELFVEEFYGEREVTSLSVVASEVWDKLDGGAVRKELEDRGRAYYSVLRTQPSHWAYEGIAISKVQKTRAYDPLVKRASQVDSLLLSLIFLPSFSLSKLTNK